MGLFFNKNKKEKTKAQPKISIDNIRKGQIMADYAVNEFSLKLMYNCNLYLRTKADLTESVKNYNSRRNTVIESYKNKTESVDLVELLVKAVKEHPTTITQKLTIRNYSILDSVEMLDYVEPLKEFIPNMSVDKFVETFFASEELQQRHLAEPFVQERSKEEFTEYLEFIQKINEQATAQYKVTNDKHLLIDKDGNLLEPDWVAQLIPIPGEAGYKE